MKKVLTLFICALLVLTCSCNNSVKSSETSEKAVESGSQATKTTVKYGLVCLHDENSTYDKNFIDAFKAACEATGVEYLIKTNIPETNACYEACIDLVDQGCNLIFADSFGHEDYVIQAAKDCPEVQFCHATGTRAHTEGLSNYHNAFASIYEGRYAAGVAAGMKLNEMMAADPTVVPLVGYVGAYQYAEVISGYTSFFLGIRSVCESATMEVIFTGSWYDQTLEAEAATKLIADGCVLISQHADSMGAPSVCENNNVPNVSYNGSTVSACPNTFIVSSRIDWQPYFELTIDAVSNGSEIPVDYVGTFATGSVKLTEVNTTAAAKGTQEELDKLVEQFKEEKVVVFDTANFTINGEHLNSYVADVDSDANYTPDTNVIYVGIFFESTYRSAPYFDLLIDGITLLVK